ncbi:MAG: class I SAM-dependent methyltransferase [Patescibacteria group bacterium]
MQNVASKTSWGGVADWYDEAVSRDGSYQKNLILPNLLRLLDIKRGKSILDVACGQGFFAREFFKQGALVTGIDVSPELINIAKEQSSSEIEFIISSADNMQKVKSDSIDNATIVLALQNIDNIKKVFEECSRVLKKNGKLFLILNHPAFRVPKNSSWGFDTKNKIQYRRIDRYLLEIKVPIQIHPGKNPKIQIVSFHRPIQYYFKLLANAGFCVSKMEEWESKKKSMPGPRADAENTARKEFPLFLFLEAVKGLN